jgi:hypothetical protein
MDEQAPPVAEEVATAAAATEGGGGDDVDDVAVEKAQKLINRILETQSNPNPKLIHSLASLLESHEARYRFCFSLILGFLFFFFMFSELYPNFLSMCLIFLVICLFYFKLLMSLAPM